MTNFHLKFIKKVNAHLRSEITNIIDNPYHQNQIITLAYDSLIIKWNSLDLSIIKYMLIPDPYLTSIVPYNGRFLVGIGSGKILQISEDISKIQNQHLIHQDCITTIIVLENYIITTSLDGYIYLLNKTTLQKQKQISIQQPIFRSIVHKNTLYICSNPSFEINLQTLEKKKLPHYNQFIVHEDVIYGCSDQVGITCLKSKYKTYIPAHFIISISKFIVFFGHSAIGYFSHDQDVQINWVMQLHKELGPGYIIQSGIVKGKYVYLVEESGYIYQFSIKKSNMKENILSGKKQSRID